MIIKGQRIYNDSVTLLKCAKCGLTFEQGEDIWDDEGQPIHRVCPEETKQDEIVNYFIKESEVTNGK